MHMAWAPPLATCAAAITSSRHQGLQQRIMHQHSSKAWAQQQAAGVVAALFCNPHSNAVRDTILQTSAQYPVQ
jgi:hypothetical protein